MILYEDSRQQEGKHKNIHAYCKRNGIKIIRQKLDVGDYSFDPVNGKISVDTKESMLELSRNIMSSDHRRFRAECELAQKLGIQLVVLIEEIPDFGRVDLWQVPRWKSENRFHKYGDPMTLVDPKALRRAMITIVQRYGVRFEFCTRRQSPARVIKILKGEFR